MKPLQRERVRQTLDQLRGELLDQRTEQGHWLGKLSTSALSTATAISALAAVRLQQPSSDESIDGLIRRGIRYLCGQQNEDGGFGDTDLSHSNIATSYLVLAAATLAGKVIRDPVPGETCGETPGATLSSDSIDRLTAYIDRQGGIEALRRRYGKDKTFVIPILANLAIAELVSWDDVQALPFEAAVFPQSMYRFLQIPVVSYAIPALVAIGQAKHFMGRRAFFPLHLIRRASVQRTMRVLETIQPESGGYLEATPLTAFVVMSLAVTGRFDNSVVRGGIRFLKDSICDDGGWPIDTNLATWVSSLAVHALACDPDDDGQWCTESLVEWHRGCQFKERHPFTGASPGGWGWTDLSGAVPDGDDTPGAILALKQFRKWIGKNHHKPIDQAIGAAEQWLSELQNRDGGWPTFCRGWGKLPFDRSSVDLTAHVLRALGDEIDPGRRKKAVRFVQRQQRDDGAWLPLWFGNQDMPDESNPVYGTSRVLIAGGLDQRSINKGVDYLLENQNGDGGWGGGKSVSERFSPESTGPAVDGEKTIISSVEETALAVEALATFSLFQRDFLEHGGVESASEASLFSGETPSSSQSERLRAGFANYREAQGEPGNESLSQAIISGIEFLLRSVDDQRHRVAWPIGFYFAKLWYHEKLYPLVFTVAALGKYLRVVAEEHDPDWPK